MSLGLVGTKCGMTRVFTETGESIPVTVVEVLPNRITQIKSDDNDGYRAIQITTGNKKQSKVNKAIAGHLAKAGTEAGTVIREFRIGTDEMPEAKLGDALTVELFKNGEKVDVQGVSKGKGFAGAVKRHNFRTQDATHGNSLSHRAAGSNGQNQSPGRVFPGKKMAGQMGNVNCSVINQEIVKIDPARNLVLIRGALPGAPGGTVIITASSRQKKERV